MAFPHHLCFLRQNLLSIGRLCCHRLIFGNGMSLWQIASEVRNAIDARRPVVALESALVTDGLPHPQNLSVALRLEEIVRSEGAVPATVALMDGKICVGLARSNLERIADPASGGQKVSLRDMANCLAKKGIGGTTVAATLWVAHRAGIQVFGTGGIGGVHRGAEQTFDISADLVQLGRTPVAVVCAGVKSILDIGKTLEFLETQSVNVVVMDRQPQFPGFFSPRTELKAPYCTESLEHVADIFACSRRLGLPGGLVLACPLPEEKRIQAQRIEAAIQEALAETGKSSEGRDVTPAVLRRLAELTEGESVRLNIALLENNAKVAARLAVHCAARISGNGIEQLHTASSPVGHIDSDQVCNIEGNETSNSRWLAADPWNQEPAKKRSKVLCVGASIVDFEVRVDSSSSSSSAGDSFLPAQIAQRPGGVARNHADALTRLGGCQVGFFSALGTDRQGQLDAGGLFLMQRGAHMDWSQVLRCPDQATATSVGICLLQQRPAISQGFICRSLMTKMDSNFIDSKAAIIEEADFVLMDANLSAEAIRRVGHWTSRSGSKIWMEPTNGLLIPKLFDAFGPQPLTKVDVFSPNLAELRMFVVNLVDGEEKAKCRHFLNSLEEFLAFPSLDSLPSRLAQLHIPQCLCPRDHLLLTCDSRGVLLVTRHSPTELSMDYVRRPDIDPQEIVSVSGAGDCFNSGFLSARLNGIGIEESLELAKECTKKSLMSVDTVPETINEAMLGRLIKTCDD